MRFAPALLAGLLALALAAPAQASSTTIDGLVVDPGFTEASFQNLHYEFGECGSAAYEVTCTWEVRAIVDTAADKDCDPSAPATTVWSSGEQSGNGSVDSGPRNFALLGCKGQFLILEYDFKKTFGDWGADPEPPLLITGGGGSFLLTHLGYEPLREAEQLVHDANPPPLLAPPPNPQPRLAVSADCRTATLGPTRFVFKFKRLGCRTATQIALAAQRTSAPSGYRCKRWSGGGGKCVRIGQPKKYVEWRQRGRAQA